MVKKKSQFTNDDMQAQRMNLSMKARVYQCFPVVSGDTIFPMSLEFLLFVFFCFVVFFERDKREVSCSWPQVSTFFQ